MANAGAKERSTENERAKLTAQISTLTKKLEKAVAEKEASEKANRELKDVQTEAKTTTSEKIKIEGQLKTTKASLADVRQQLTTTTTSLDSITKQAEELRAQLETHTSENVALSYKISQKEKEVGVLNLTIDGIKRYLDTIKPSDESDLRGRITRLVDTHKAQVEQFESEIKKHEERHEFDEMIIKDLVEQISAFGEIGGVGSIKDELTRMLEKIAISSTTDVLTEYQHMNTLLKTKKEQLQGIIDSSSKQHNMYKSHASALTNIIFDLYEQIIQQSTSSFNPDLYASLKGSMEQFTKLGITLDDDELQERQRALESIQLDSSVSVDDSKNLEIIETLQKKYNMLVSAHKNYMSFTNDGPNSDSLVASIHDFASKDIHIDSTLLILAYHLSELYNKNNNVFWGLVEGLGNDEKDDNIRYAIQFIYPYLGGVYKVGNLLPIQMLVKELQETTQIAKALDVLITPIDNSVLVRRSSILSVDLPKPKNFYEISIYLLDVWNSISQARTYVGIKEDTRDRVITSILTSCNETIEWYKGKDLSGDDNAIFRNVLGVQSYVKGMAELYHCKSSIHSSSFLKKENPPYTYWLPVLNQLSASHDYFLTAYEHFLDDRVPPEFFGCDAESIHPLKFPSWKHFCLEGINAVNHMIGHAVDPLTSGNVSSRATPHINEKKQIYVGLSENVPIKSGLLTKTGTPVACEPSEYSDLLYKFLISTLAPNEGLTRDADTKYNELYDKCMSASFGFHILNVLNVLKNIRIPHMKFFYDTEIVPNRKTIQTYIRCLLCYLGMILSLDDYIKKIIERLKYLDAYLKDNNASEEFKEDLETTLKYLRIPYNKIGLTYNEMLLYHNYNSYKSDNKNAKKKLFEEYKKTLGIEGVPIPDQSVRVPLAVITAKMDTMDADANPEYTKYKKIQELTRQQLDETAKSIDIVFDSHIKENFVGSLEAQEKFNYKVILDNCSSTRQPAHKYFIQRHVLTFYASLLHEYTPLHYKERRGGSKINNLSSYERTSKRKKIYSSNQTRCKK